MSGLSFYEPYQVTSGCIDIMRPVGQIVKYVGARGEYKIEDRFCSGFNIGHGYFLTAGHCLSEQNVCYIDKTHIPLTDMWINFGYQYEQKEEKSSRYEEGKRIVLQNGEFSYK